MASTDVLHMDNKHVQIMDELREETGVNKVLEEADAKEALLEGLVERIVEERLAIKAGAQ